MFQNWGFLLGEIWGLVLLAALLGLLAGWLIWSRGSELLELRSSLDDRERELNASKSQFAALETEAGNERVRFASLDVNYQELQTSYDDAQSELAARGDRISTLEARLAELEANAEDWDANRIALVAARDAALGDVTERDDQIVSLRGDLDLANRQGADLDTRLAELNAAHLSTSEEVGRRDKRIGALETDLRLSIEREQALGGAKEELDAALEAKNKAESDHAEEIFRVRRRDEEVSRLKLELANFEGDKGQVASLEGKLAAATAEAGRLASLEAQLASAKAKANKAAALEAEIASRDAELARLRDEERKAAGSDGQVAQMRAALDECRNNVHSRDQVIDDLRAQMNSAARDYDGDGVIEGRNEGIKPATLTAARGGLADDLKRIKGVGPKLEALLHELGFFHFDQVADWTADEVAWVDANLEGFNGRVSRDRWIEQAKILAAGGVTEFAARVDDGEVYDS